MKNTFIAAFFMLVSMSVSAQTLDRMQWFNEPENWSVKNDVLTMASSARRRSHLPDARRVEWLKKNQE